MNNIPEEEFICPHCDSVTFDVQVVTKVDNFGQLINTRTYRTIVCSECKSKAKVKAIDQIKYRQKLKSLEEDPWAEETTNAVEPPQPEQNGRPKPMKLSYERDARKPQKLWF